MVASRNFRERNAGGNSRVLSTEKSRLPAEATKSTTSMTIAGNAPNKSRFTPAGDDELVDVRSTQASPPSVWAHEQSG
jgi:hypothetical protein